MTDIDAKARGELHNANLDGWHVSWESLGDYRLWCKQEHPSNARQAAVVMLNPGSLSGNGERLSQDTTLRILRDIFLGTGYNPYIVNLFTLVAPDPEELFDAWPKRDCPGFDLESLDWSGCSAVLFAYGAYETIPKFSDAIKERIREVRSVLAGTPEILVPLAKTGTPKHPMRIQIESLKDEFRKRIIEQAGSS